MGARVRMRVRECGCTGVRDAGTGVRDAGVGYGRAGATTRRARRVRRSAFALDEGLQYARDADLIGGAVERVAVEHDQVGVLADLDRAGRRRGGSHRPNRRCRP